MKHVKVLLIKFVTCLIVFWISLDLFFEATFSIIVSYSLLVTAISYLIGDQIVLPRVGKRNSVVVDFFLTYLIVWIFGSFFLHSYMQIAWGSIIAATLIAGSEVFVHSYILKNVKSIIKEHQQNFQTNFAYEFAEEQDLKPKKRE